MGTLVEINLHREFDFADGTVTDYRIDGIEVDCKFSAASAAGRSRSKPYGHLCLVVWADDQRSRGRPASCASATSSCSRHRTVTGNAASTRPVSNRSFGCTATPSSPRTCSCTCLRVTRAIFSHRGGPVAGQRTLSPRSTPARPAHGRAHRRATKGRTQARARRPQASARRGHDHPRPPRRPSPDRAIARTSATKKGEWVSARLVETPPARPVRRRCRPQTYRLAER